MTGLAKLHSKRILVTGAGGQLGSYLLPLLPANEVLATGSTIRHGVDEILDIRDAEAVASTVSAWKPDVIFHAAAWTDVDGAERDPEGARAVNVDGSRNVAVAAARAGARLIAVSTDFVFSGTKGEPYMEGDPTDPISVYGATKRDGEIAMLEACPTALVARTAWLYGGAGKHFPRTVVTVLRDRGSIEVVDDEFGSPTFAADLAKALVEVAATDLEGVVHFVNSGRASRYEFAERVAAKASFRGGSVLPTSTQAFLAKYPLPARRPADSELLNTRAKARSIELRTWQEAVDEYVPRLAHELDLMSSTRQGV